MRMVQIVTAAIVISMTVLASSNKALRRGEEKIKPTTIAEMTAELLKQDFKDDEEYESYMEEIAKRTEEASGGRRGIHSSGRKLQDIENCDVYEQWFRLDRSALVTYDSVEHACPTDEQLIVYTAWLHSHNGRTCLGDRYMGSELMKLDSNTGHDTVAEAVRHYYTLHQNTGSCTYDPWILSNIMCCEL